LKKDRQKLVVVISDSVTPANVNTKFKTVTVPVVTLDPQLFDDMGMTTTATTNFGTTATQKNVTITNSTHPMAAGLSGTIQVTSANTTFGWGVVNANAAKIATLTTDATKATDFGYDINAVMPGLTAPRRRVGFFQIMNDWLVLKGNNYIVQSEGKFVQTDDCFVQMDDQFEQANDCVVQCEK
jgi:hypothetical protein